VEFFLRGILESAEDALSTIELLTEPHKNNVQVIEKKASS